MSTDNDAAWAALGKTLLVLLAVPLMSLPYAWVYARLWLWFVVPLGAPVIGYAHAYGLAIILSIAKTQYNGKDQRETWEKWVHPWFGLFFLWASAVIAHWCMG